MHSYHKRSRGIGGRTRIPAILDPSTQEITYDDKRIAEIFTLHHQQKTDDVTIDEEADPELNSPLMHKIATKYGLNLKETFPEQPDDTDEEVSISLKKLESMVRGLKADTAPGKSGCDKHVLAWFIEYFPNVFLQAFNFLLANPDWENSMHSAYLKRRKIVFLPKK